MNPLLAIARFEFRYHFRQPTFYLFAALILAQGIWATYRLETLFATGSPTIDAYYVLAMFGLVLAIVTVLLAGQSLTKDVEFRTDPYLYTLPVTSRVHFAGRFLGTYLTTLVLAVFYPLGILLWFSIYRTSAVPWEALIDGFIRLVSLNSFIIASITFSLTVFMRSVRGAYISLFLVVLYFLLAASDDAASNDSDTWRLLDPFGVGMVRESIDNMSFSDTLLAFSDMLFINRLLWIGLALGALAQAETRFSFDSFSHKQSDTLALPSERSEYQLRNKAVLVVQPQFDRQLQWQTTFRLAWMEFQNLVRQPVFQITTGLLVVLTIMLATSFNLNPDFPELPITSRMTALRLPMGSFIGLFLILMTGELIVHERTIGFWPIYDALPQPNTVLLFAKLIAMAGAAILLTLALFLTGIGLQIGAGFGDIDWQLYLSDLLMDGLLRYWQLIALGALVASLVNNRIVGHLINLLIFGALTASYEFNSSDETTFLYSFLPGSATYSDLIGYGLNTAIRPILHVIWWSIAGLFVTSFILTWNRGITDSLHERVRQWPGRFGWSYELTLAGAGAVFGFGLWQLKEHRYGITSTPVRVQYAIQTTTIMSISGRSIGIQVKYYHPYQVQQILKVAQAAMRKGEQLFGAYPYPSIQVLEIPVGTIAVRSKPGQIDISEKQGWTADYKQPQKLDYIDYLVSREVFKQWLVQGLHSLPQPGTGFIQQSLAEYLALQEVARKYGPDQLKKRLAQRAALYISSRNRNRKPEVSVLQSNGNNALERGRGTLALTSIGQVWGDAPLSLTIGQFYQQAIQQPTSATANAFAGQLMHHLPDSLRYLTTYLTDQVWFDFKIGRIANLANGLSVEVIPVKWREKSPGQRQPLPINDYVPFVVLDGGGHEIYRRLIHPNPDEQFVHLPALPTAKAVLVDPLGAWPEPNKRDNYKTF